MTIPTSARCWFALFILSAIPAFAVNRVLTITAPTVVHPGAPVHVTVTASTDANDGEEIAFFHTAYSADGGKTWMPVFAEKVGPSATRYVDFKAGANGTKIFIRSRMAFRGGQAGDVDYTGARIVWNGSWDNWSTPPAKVIAISVTTK